MNIQEIIEELAYFDGIFPRQALKEAVRKKDEITPALLDILRSAKENINEIVERDDYMAHMYALYLLAQFREKQAYPLIVDFFSIPGEITLEITGDIVTEDLSRILASVCRGDTSLVTQLAENESANEFVRNAALESLLCLVVSGDKSREEVLEYYKSLFHSNLSRSEEHAFFWASLVSACTDLYPEEVYEEIKQAFNDEIVDEMVLDLKFVDQQMALGKPEILSRLRRNNNDLISDTIAEMEHWAGFQPSQAPAAPVKKKKIGRNEPCPCGSGKKYKKCCGA